MQNNEKCLNENKIIENNISLGLALACKYLRSSHTKAGALDKFLKLKEDQANLTLNIFTQECK